MRLQTCSIESRARERQKALGRGYLPDKKEYLPRQRRRKGTRGVEGKVLIAAVEGSPEFLASVVLSGRWLQKCPWGR